MKNWIVLCALLLAAGARAQQTAQLPYDGRKTGFVYFEDRFNWVNARFGGEDHMNGSFGKVGPRVDGLPESLKPLMKASGWITSNRYLYVRLGYFQVGRGGDAGDIISPKFNDFDNSAFPMLPPRYGIAPGTKADVRVSFDLAIFRSANGRRDRNPIVVEILGDGVFDDLGNTELELTVENYNKWKNFAVVVRGATSRTRIRVKSGNINREAGPSRFFFDRFKVEKAK
ncbi:hypothetical protein [Alistipes sp.]|uniref:hypothetical protein n=1 Tax=Alistipes sp. TaxID=1872444 RepID=UPI003AF0A674